MKVKDLIALLSSKQIEDFEIDDRINSVKADTEEKKIYFDIDEY